MKKYWLAFILLAALVFLPGCMSVGPDYARPEPDFTIPETFESAVPAQRDDHVAPVQGPSPWDDPWWESFNDPMLNAIVDRVVSGSHDIREAAANVKNVRHLAVMAGAGRYPQAAVTGSVIRNNYAIEHPLLPRRYHYRSSIYDFSVPATFEIDFFGRIARASEAAEADFMEAIENQRIVVQSMIAETVLLYLEIGYIDEQIRIAGKMIKAARLNLEMVENRYESGLSPLVEVYQARRFLARCEANLPVLEENAGIARQGLFILQGHYPSSELPVSGFSGPCEQLVPIPEGLPSDLLERRPDIQAAEARLTAASARIGMTRAERFPRFALTVEGGATSDSLFSYSSFRSRFWRFGAEGFMPLMDGGRIRHAEKAAWARFEAMNAAYLKTMLDAFGDVEAALTSRKKLRDRGHRQAELLAEAVAAEKVAKDRYKKGLTSYFTVLEASQARYRAEIGMTESRFAMLANRVNLHRALGGGWDPKPGR